MDRYFSKIILWGIYLTLFIPLLFTPFTFFPWLFGKTIIFQIIVELLLFLYLISRWWGREPPRVVRVTALDWAVLGWLVVLTLAAVLGTDFGHSFWGDQARASGVFTWWHFGAWYWLLRRSVTEPGQWERILSLSALVAVLAALTAVFQKYLPTSWQGVSGERLFGIIGNPDFLAAYLIPALGLTALCLYRRGRQSSHRWWSWRGGLGFLVIIFLTGVLLFTGSRAALLSLGSAVLLSLVMVAALVREAPIRRSVLFILGGSVVVAAGLLLSLRLGAVAARLPALARLTDPASWLEETGATRRLAWEIALKGVRERPILGWGPNTYEAVFSKYYNPRFLQFSFSETVWDKPHNWFLEVAVGAGLIGLVAYGGLLAAAGYCLVAGRKSEPASSDFGFTTFERIIAGGTLVAYAVYQLFLFETTNSLLLWFVLLAFIGGSVPGTVTARQSFVARWPKNLRTALVVLLGGCLAAVLYKFSLVPLSASYHLQKSKESPTLEQFATHAPAALAKPVPWRGEVGVFLAEEFVQRDKQGALTTTTTATRVGEQIINALQFEAERHSRTIALPVWTGQVAMVLGQQSSSSWYAVAQLSLNAARALSPEKQDVLFLLGRLYLLQKDFSKAIAVQEAAVAADPTIGTSRWFLGLTLLTSGQSERALSEIETARALGYALNRDQTLFVLDLYAASKKYDMVITGYRALVEAEPENVNWYIKLATAYALAGERAAALDTVRRAVQLYPPLKPAADEFIKEYHLQ